MDFAARLKVYRTNAKLSQEQLAEKLHVSRQAITKWETGRGLPDMENLISVAKLLDVSIDELIYGEVRSELTRGFKYESKIEYDLDEVKHFDLVVEAAKNIKLRGYDGEKLHVSLMSDEIANLARLLKIKLDDQKKILDLTLKKDKALTIATLQENLFVEILLPKEYLGSVELQSKADSITITDLKQTHLELGGKLHEINLEDLNGRVEIDCNTDLKINCANSKGRLEINQIKASSILHLSEELKIQALVSGMKNQIFFATKGSPSDDFSSESPDLTIELNGLKSELIIDRGSV
ncbi:MAG: helix-turn-helix domain-containing protein [Bacillota bacterium]|nr:helix-turn-helix domain-containing protein [Bacillota bacterium]